MPLAINKGPLTAPYLHLLSKSMASIHSAFQSGNNMTCEIFFVSRLLLQLILLVLFLHFFGLPAIWRFQAKEVRKSNEMILTTNISLNFFGHLLWFQQTNKFLCLSSLSSSNYELWKFAPWGNFILRQIYFKRLTNRPNKIEVL